MATTCPVEWKRHYRELSSKEVDELVSVVADLIVEFLKGKHEGAQPDKYEQKQEVLA